MYPEPFFFYPKESKSILVPFRTADQSELELRSKEVSAVLSFFFHVGRRLMLFLTPLPSIRTPPLSLGTLISPPRLLPFDAHDVFT